MSGQSSAGTLPGRAAIAVFLAFAFAYFLSALIRAITATLAPTLTAEFALHSGSLGLLAGAYFLGFAAMQLPLGTWLDRYGPRTVSLGFMAVAVAGCLAFAWAGSFGGLLVARILCGVGVSACLMAPLLGFRHWLTPTIQLRANSWMLMTGSFGMLASTLPVQWLVPHFGWRPLFVVLALAICAAMAVIALRVPRWPAPPGPGAAPARSGGEPHGYAAVWRHPYFRKMALVGFVNYGGMVAIQTLWAGPWMVRVSGYSALEAATGLFWINFCMLATFWTWGLVMPYLARRGVRAEQLVAWGLPLSFMVLAVNIGLGSATGWWNWALFCAASTFVSLSQPAVALALPASLAGRALSAYNLVIFSGVFLVQWGLGLLIDGFSAAGLGAVDAFRAAMALFGVACLGSYLHFLRARVA